MKQATIILDMYKSGIHLTCEDTDHDVFIPHGDGNALMKELNAIYDVTDPDATWELTEKGKRVAYLMDNKNLTFEEACAQADEEYNTVRVGTNIKMEAGDGPIPVTLKRKTV